MSVLVTGGAGYIGSHAVQELLREGFDVVVLDDLSKGHREAIDRSVPFYQASLSDTGQLQSIFREHSIEAVLHFAAFIEVGESVRDPERYYRNNFCNALQLLQAMKDHGVGKFIFSSTAAVYGNPLSIPIDEDHPRCPINPYGRSKMMTELAAEDFCRAYGMGCTILRYFNVAGASPDARIGEAHEPETHLIPRVLATAHTGTGTVDIYGTDYPTEDGTCIRDYVHVIDLVRAHILALKSAQPSQSRVYNLGSESGFSVRQVIETCQNVVGRKLEVHAHERRPGDPAILIASSRKIRRELRWERRYPDLRTIIEHAWHWHARHPHGYSQA